MVKKENKLVVFTVTVEELLNNNGSGIYDNEPVVLSDYGTLERLLELPEDNHSRRLLEWKISHGEIHFLNEAQRMKNTQFLRDLSPRKNNSDNNWLMNHHRGNCVGYMECKYHDCPGIIKFSQIEALIRPLRGLAGKDSGNEDYELSETFYVSLHIPCCNHLYLLPDNIGGYSRKAYQGVCNAIGEEITRLDAEICKYQGDGGRNKMLWIKICQNKMKQHLSFYRNRIISTIDSLCREHCHSTLISLIKERKGLTNPKLTTINLEEIFDVYENTLKQDAAPNDVITSGSAVDSSTVCPVDKVMKMLKEQYEELKNAVDKSELPPDAVSKEWIMKRKQDLLSSLSSVRILNKKVVALYQALIHEITSCTSLEVSMNATENTSVPISVPQPCDDDLQMADEEPQERQQSTTMVSPSYLPSSMLVGKWSVVFRDATESVINDCFMVFSSFYSLQRVFNEVNDLDDSDTEVGTLMRGMEGLHNVAASFESVFGFSIPEDSEYLEQLDEAGVCGQDSLSEQCSAVEEGNLAFLEEMRRESDISLIRTTSSISSLVDTCQAVSDSNAAFIAEGLRSPVPSTVSEVDVPPVEIEDDIQIMMNRLYDDVYKKLSGGEWDSAIANYFLTLFLADGQSPQYFVKQKVDIDSIIANSLENNISKRDTVAEMVRRGISKSAAYRAYNRLTLQDLSREDTKKALTYLFGILNKEDDGGYYDYSQTEAGNILSVTMIPSISRVMYQENQDRVITIDGAHTCYSHLKIIIGVMKDGNGKLQIVAVRLCPSESEADFKGFLTDIKEHIIGNGPNPIIVSDRAMGLIAAAKEVFGGDFQINSCLVHLLRNVDAWASSYSLKIKQRKKVRSIVARLAKTQDSDTAKNLWEELESIAPKIKERLLGLDSIWCRLMTKEKTFGVVTNNAAECTNSLMKRSLDMETSIRDASFFDMVISLYSLIQTQQEVRNGCIKKYINDKRSEYDTNDTITPYVMRLINRSKSLICSDASGPARIRNWKVVNDKVCVTVRNNNSFYVVNLIERSCTCGMFQLTQYPCIHAVMYLHHHGHDISPTMVKLVDPHYRSSTVLRSSQRSLPNVPEITRDDIGTVRDDDLRRHVHVVSVQASSSLSTAIRTIPQKGCIRGSSIPIAVRSASAPILRPQPVDTQKDNLLVEASSEKMNSKDSTSLPLPNKDIISNRKRRTSTRLRSRQEFIQNKVTNGVRKSNADAGPSQGICTRSNNPFEETTLTTKERTSSRRMSKRTTYKRTKEDLDGDYVPSHSTLKMCNRLHSFSK